MVVSPLDIPDLLSFNLGLAETGAKGKAGGVVHLPLLLFGLGIVLCVRIAVPFLANGAVFPADDFAHTSTTLRQAQDMAQYRPGRGVSWVLVPSGFPPVLTGCGCSAIMSGKVTMSIRLKSAHGVIIQEDFRKCNPVDCLGGFRLRYRNSGGRRIPYKK